MPPIYHAVLAVAVLLTRRVRGTASVLSPRRRIETENAGEPLTDLGVLCRKNAELGADCPKLRPDQRCVRVTVPKRGEPRAYLVEFANERGVSVRHLRHGTQPPRPRRRHSLRPDRSKPRNANGPVETPGRQRKCGLAKLLGELQSAD
jgi:hypothetical protein